MTNPDHLYELLPSVYRDRDGKAGFPLRALLKVVGEQVDVVEDDIRQQYENWFIETCEEWVVPYIGDLLGYQLLNDTGEPADVDTPREQQRERFLIPRRDVANTIRFRRRKGTLALLEQLANDSAGWPARAVEFYKLLGWTQNINHLYLHRGRTVDLRDGNALDLIDGPFDTLAHTVDVRRITSNRSVGRYNIPSVGVFVWRLKSYSVTKTQAHCLDDRPHCYTFSVLGNDGPLFTRPVAETEPAHIADEINVPCRIRRRAFEIDRSQYYGEGKSIQIWRGSVDEPIPADEIVVADLTDWHYQDDKDKVAVDPVLGRFVFPKSYQSRKHVWVSYRYGFSADIGGGEYDRPISQPEDAEVYRVRHLSQLKQALDPWQQDRQHTGEEDTEPKTPLHAVIEITDSGVYTLPINLVLRENQSLQLRAANGVRPVIRLLDCESDLPDALSITGGRGSRFTLDGLLITGRGVLVSSPAGEPASGGDLCDVTIRHCTLVPGWSLDCDCEPGQKEEPSLELHNTSAHVKIEHSILGSIEVTADSRQTEPVRIDISDSIWDSTRGTKPVLSDTERRIAYTRLKVLRCTVFGEVKSHEIILAENSIFNDCIAVARRQVGCMRFCYVHFECQTPRRYECQPDMVRQAVQDKYNRAQGTISLEERDGELESETLRVEPAFNSTRYGTPTYCQLANTCADEIKHGADDESEMGAFHDLFQPQRTANLCARLDEYTPAGTDAGIIFAS